MALSSAFGQGAQAGSQAVTRGIGLRQSEQQIQQKKQEAVLSSFNDTLEQAVTTAKTIRENATQRQMAGEQVDMGKVNQLIDTIKNQTVRSATALRGGGLPVDPDLTSQQFEAIKSAPTSQQQAQVAGQTEAVKQEAVAQATGETESYFDPRVGGLVGVRVNDQQAVDDIIAAGGFPSTGESVVDDPSKLSASERKAQTEANEALGAVQTGASAIKSLTDVPGAAGVPGMITEIAGGFMGSIGLTDVEKSISNFFSGADPEEVKAARSKFITFQGSMARSILQDSRISDYERRILNQAMGATGPTASPKALIGSYKNILATATTVSRRKNLEANKDILDLDTDAGINSLGQQLVNSGLTNEDAVDFIKKIMQIESITQP